MINTLHIDIEGGWGGSSRSLYHLVSRLDRSKFNPLVAHRQEGPLQDWYREIGIPTVHVPDIYSFAPRKRNSWKIFLGSIPRLFKLPSSVQQLALIAKNHNAQAIHLNYEGLFLLAAGLKRRTGLPLIGHSRTLIPENIWGRWVVRSLARTVDHMFFITPQEKARFDLLCNPPYANGQVLWNIAPDPDVRGPRADPPEAVYLGNISHAKGADRLLAVAGKLAAMNAPPLKIAVYGKARHNEEFEQGLRSRIQSLGLDDRIELRGYTTQVAQVLSSAFALIRPSRDNDPWGRDVIEATRFGVPILATGSFAGVVEPGATGYLFDPFDSGAMAEKLSLLASDEQLWQHMSEAASAAGERKFSGIKQIPAATRVFENLVANVKLAGN